MIRFPSTRKIILVSGPPPNPGWFTVRAHLPSWSGVLTPHGLRHFCASSLYAQGMDLKAVQELLGHDWLSTTTRYIHVHDNHIEQAWAAANQRVAARLDGNGR